MTISWEEAERRPNLNQNKIKPSIRNCSMTAMNERFHLNHTVSSLAKVYSRIFLRASQSICMSICGVRMNDWASQILAYWKNRSRVETLSARLLMSPHNGGGDDDEKIVMLWILTYPPKKVNNRGTEGERERSTPKNDGWLKITNSHSKSMNFELGLGCVHSSNVWTGFDFCCCWRCCHYYCCCR